MNIGPSFALRILASFVAGVLCFWLTIACLFKFAYQWSHHAEAELGLAMVAAVAFMLLLVSIVTLVFSLIGGWKNVDRMKSEELKGWQEEMLERRKRNREAVRKGQPEAN